MKFSLVVPFWNAKDYLPACVDSILAQDYSGQIEILLIDNNSTDGTAKIAAKYARDHTQIKLLHCKTVGAGAARNCGIRAAQGDYVWCIDSDDWIESDSLSKLAAKITELGRPDVITFGAIKDYDAGMTQRGKTELLPVGKGQAGWQKRFVMYGFGPWQYVARRQWLLENQLFFDEKGILIHEDMALISSFVLYSKEIYPLDATLYHYVQHAQSVLHRKSWDARSLDIFPALELLYARFERAGLKYADALEYFFIWNLLIDTVYNFKQFPEGRAYFHQIRETLRQYFPHWRRNPFLRKKSLKFRLRLFLNYWS